MASTEHDLLHRPNDTEAMDLALLGLVRLIARQAVEEFAEVALQPTKKGDDDVQE